MPTINCPDCKKSISDSATVCPKCGRNITAEDVERGKKINKNSQIAAVAIVGVFLLLFAFCSFKGNSAPKDVSINANVKYNGSQLVIINMDSYAWTDVKIRLNGDYILRPDTLKAKTTYKVGIRQFADDDNNTFNPYSTKLKSVSISCMITNARGFYYAEWND